MNLGELKKILEKYPDDAIVVTVDRNVYLEEVVVSEVNFIDKSELVNVGFSVVAIGGLLHTSITGLIMT